MTLVRLRKQEFVDHHLVGACLETLLLDKIERKNLGYASLE